MPKEEYDKRLAEIKKLLTFYPNVKIIEGVYNNDIYIDKIKGLENEIEGSTRCYECYKLRMQETVLLCQQNNFDYFATTLTVSPYKNANKINELGSYLAENYNKKYLYSDFKKKNGYKKSIELAKKYNLYRQNYCGCIFSK